MAVDISKGIYFKGKEKMTYQKTTGSLMASGYQKLGTQEVMNDMYVTASNWDGTQISPTLTKNNANGGQRMPDKDNFNCVIGEENMETTVRRLTPTECERLQGYPDGWTIVGYPEMVEVKDYKIAYDDDGNEISKECVGTHKEMQYFYKDENGKRKKCSDSARYKALGNSIALPYWFHLLRKISAQYERPATLGSLFDGIGGFPLCWERCNGTGTARWASEIEEFPIAVTKKHFGDEDAGIEGDVKEYL